MKKKIIQNLKTLVFEGGGAQSVMAFIKMDTVTWVQNLDVAVCISYCANTLGKGMNPITLSPVMGK